MSRGANHRITAHIAAAIVVLVLAVAIISGCGGGSSSPTSTGGTSGKSSSSSTSSAGASKTSFVADADAICKQLNANFAKKTLPKKLTPAAIARLSPGRALLEKAGVDELERLSAPATAKVTWEQLLVARRALAKELAELGRAAKKGDQKGIEKLTASKKAHHAQEKTAASKLGLKDCATVG